MTTAQVLPPQEHIHLVAQAATAHAILFLATDGRVMEWSAGARQLLGWQAEEIRGAPFAILFTPEDRAAGAPEAELQTALSNGRAADIRWHVRKDGSRFYADGMTYPVYDDGGEHIGFGKILHEAHAAFGRRLSEREQERSAEREFLAAVLDNIEDGVVACNPDGMLTLFNRATREFHGIAEAALPPEQWAQHYDLCAADGVTPLPTEEIPLFRALRGEHVREVEMVIAPKSGKRRRVLASGRPLVGAGGENLGAVVSMHDISMQDEAQAARAQASSEQARRAEAEAVAEQLRRSEERFRSLVMATTQIVWSANADGQNIEDSRTWRDFTGQTYEEAKGWGWLNALHPDDRESTARAWAKSIGEQKVFEAEYRLRRADGSYRWTTVRGVPVHNSDGSVREWVGVNTDVTDVRQAQEAMRISERYAFEAAQEAAAERRRLQAVLEAAPVGIFVTDGAGAVVHTNRENRRLWGEAQPTPDNLAEYRRWKGWWADGSDRQGRRIEADEWPVAEALRGEPVPQTIIEIEPFDQQGARRTVLASAAPVMGDEGQVTGGVVALMDITDRVRAEATLRETAARLQFTLQAAQIGDWDLDLSTDVAHRSLLHDRCFGYTEPVADWGLEKFVQHVHRDDRARVQKGFQAAVDGLKDWHFECRVVWPDGSVHWIATHGSVYGIDGKPSRMAGIVFDITERKQAEEKVRHASLHDPLTGLPNRAMLFEYASHLLPHNKRTNQCAAVLFLDLDRFKPINDTHGHEIGDRVLRELAARLSRSLRAEDLVVRLGGDEFVVLLQDIRTAAYAAEVASHIAEAVNEPFRVGELTLSLSTSVGISIFPRDGDDIDALISHADMAMYQAKQAGRNNFQFYSPEYAAGTRLQLVIEEQLKSALATEGFHLFYQPVLDLQNGEVVSVEALLRWQNKDIGPDRFVPIAEATGIINPIGRWLLEEAMRQHKKWLEHGLPPIPIAVNVSVVEFRDRGFVSRFKRTLREHGVDAAWVQLELTETAVMDDIDHAVSVLGQLKALGLTILLDDFGTGHSSLAYLARLPLDKVKIDRSFISRLESDGASRTVTDAMIGLARAMELEVVAEGIDSERVLAHVRSRGCRQGQGFYLGLPLSGQAFESWYLHERPGVLGK